MLRKRDQLRISSRNDATHAAYKLLLYYRDWGQVQSVEFAIDTEKILLCVHFIHLKGTLYSIEMLD
jgi:hypothetical protein